MHVNGVGVCGLLDKGSLPMSNLKAFLLYLFLMMTGFGIAMIWLPWSSNVEKNTCPGDESRVIDVLYPRVMTIESVFDPKELTAI